MSAAPLPTQADEAIAAGRRALLAGASERDFQAAVVRTARLRGWRVYWTWRSEHSPAGEFDLRLVRPPRVVFAELKTLTGRLTPAQEATLAALRQCPGVEVFVWKPDSWEEINRVLD